ncbi:hypothetical protein CWE15_11510 [Aliidiomarina taiwanensis]|uniref:Uncharacterized protein n=1 Tax=Aliidiomarina taiwanensis TaxID=946228 RepID=A0A432WTM5_9GAMM|nr:hypothetical protein [Aliidiomarina taiwanensis]RUO37130.1 hypothetical protein CWE15_11510 [Aliidiomarina taiwanensis]
MSTLSRPFIRLVFTACVGLSATAHSAEQTQPPSPQQQALVDALSGQFSNFYALTEYPNTVGDFPPLLYTGESITLPTGQQAVLVSQYHFDVSGSQAVQGQTPLRKQLYAFVTPAEETAAVHVSYPVPNQVSAEALRQAEVFSQLQRLPGCETYWTAATNETGNHYFEGYRNPKRCYFLNTDNQSQVHVESIHYVTATEQKITENLLSNDGEPLDNMELAGTLVLHPIRFFNVEAAYLPEGAEAEQAEAWVHIEPVGTVHDHGQRLNLHTQHSQQLIPYQIRVLRQPNTPQQVRVSLYSLGEHTALEEIDVNLHEAPRPFTLGPLRLTLTLAGSEH